MQNEERKQARKEELRRLIDSFEMAQQITGSGSWEHDLERDVLLWSTGFYHLLRIDDTTTPPDPARFLSLLHPDDRDSYTRTLNAALKEHDTFVLEVRFYPVPADLRILQLQGKVIRDPQGRPLRMYGVARDVTHERSVKEQLKYRIAFEELLGKISTRYAYEQSDRLDETIARTLQEIGLFSGVDRSYLFVLNENGTVMRKAREWCAEGIEPIIAGTPDIPVDSLPWFMGFMKRSEFFYIPDVSAMPEAAKSERDLFLSQKIRSILCVPMGYGEKLLGFYGYDAIRSVKEWTSDDIRLLKTVGEITAASLTNLQATQELTQANLALMEAQRIARMGNWEWNMVRDELKISAELRDLLGIEESGSQLFEILRERIPEEDVDSVKYTIRNAGELGEDFATDCRIRFADGTQGTLSIRGRIARDSEGRPEKVIGTAQDVTEARRILEELDAYRVHLEQRVQSEIDNRRQKEQLLIQQSKMAAMGEMIGAIAHQWRQPLNLLAILVQDLQESFQFHELTEENLARTVTSTMEQIDYMSKTIDDFRNFFRPSTTMEPFSVCDAVRDSLNIVAAQLKHNYILVHLLCPAETGGSPLLVYGYPGEFKQVILNIINNAKDAIAERIHASIDENFSQGSISITVLSDGETVRIAIKDNGGGVPSGIVARLFQPYFTTKPRDRGTGLGLYMSKIIIEEHLGGTLTFQNSEENGEKGAIFTLEMKRYSGMDA